MPYVVVHDEDALPEPLPEDWSADKTSSKRRTFALNQTISDIVKEPIGRVVMLSPDIEGEGGISRSQGKKIGKALAALDHFEGVEAEDIPEPLRALVKACYQPLSEAEEEAAPMPAAPVAPLS